MARVPLATYRLQFNRDFGFRAARALVPYLESLGISDLYSSPLVQARRGSRHGYDVTDPSRLNAELGSEAEFNALAGVLKRRGMGLLLDIVPNHMAASSENPWWRDVLENGSASPYADYFDIDWLPEDEPALTNKIVLPLLGAPYEEVRRRGELSLALDESGLAVRYYGHTFPLALRSYPHILGYRLDAMRNQLGVRHPALRALEQWMKAVERLPQRPGAKRARQRRHTRQEGLKARLRRLCRQYPPLRKHIEENLQLFNRPSVNPRADSLSALLEGQHYRLVYWKTREAQINYRRFFDVSALVSLRIDDATVFAARHELLFRLVRQGKVTGARIDHIDGLYDPTRYLEQLQVALGGRRKESRRRFYVVVEKILAEQEELPDNWLVSGTTGYDFLNTLNGIFVDGRGRPALTRSYMHFTGSPADFGDVVYSKKKLVMEMLFPGEMRTLLAQLARLAAASPQANGLRRDDLEKALMEVTACLPVYRTYTTGVTVSRQDRRSILVALREAARRNDNRSRRAFTFLRRILLLEKLQPVSPALRRARLAFVRRWQQFSGPIMAKGFEDTALYNYNRLVSLNEVGGSPGRMGLPPEELHRRMRARQRQWPGTLNATATHDTKRGEDVRARINVLSELAGEWSKHVRQWSRWNKAKKQIVEGQPVPDGNEEWLLYQTLVGTWPLERRELSPLPGRLQEYIVKAAREAKVHTRWREVNEEYEKALRAFVEALLAESSDNRFFADFHRLQQKVAFHGALNGLAQVTLKIAAPGVPDFYQGAELWDLRLVDPDNRQPVDFERRRRLLDELMEREACSGAELLSDLIAQWPDGRIKLFITWKGLTFRRAHPALFLEGDYIPLHPWGPMKEHVCAFARRWKNQWAVVAAPRLTTRLVQPGEFPLGKKTWGSTALALPRNAPRCWRNVFTGEAVEAERVKGRRVVSLARVFRRLPVALLAALASDPSPE
jgi:(1->4)-alpha-D-glucan 1-alpha-D-glucosylmutase